MIKNIYIIGIFLTACIVLSCSGKNKGGIEREDSISMVDSTDDIESIKEASEQARPDSIRQDSINNASAGLTFQTFTKKSSPTLLTTKEIGRNLVELGFQLADTKTHKINDPWDFSDDAEKVNETLTTYTKTIGERTTKVVVSEIESDLTGVEISFSNSKEKKEFDQTYKNKFKNLDKCDWDVMINEKGNSVSIIIGSPCAA